MGNQVVVPTYNTWYIPQLKKADPTIDVSELGNLDSGTFFLVFDGKRSTNSEKVVIKAYQFYEELGTRSDVQYGLNYFETLKKHPTLRGIVSYDTASVVSKGAILIRKKLSNCLYDIIAFQQPKFDMYEKWWTIFQIHKALLSLNELELSHGDLKPNNIFMMDSTEIVLVDMAPYKPLIIEEPHLFYHFFASNSTAGYYLAPERMFHKDSKPINRILADYFSFGCILAFIFLDGKHLFSVASIKEYCEGTFDLATALKPIGNDDVIDVITGLLSLSPEERKPAFDKVVQIMPAGFAELHEIMYNTSDQLDKLEKVAEKMKGRMDKIILNFVVSRVQDWVNLKDIITGIEFIKNFSNRVQDPVKCTHVIPALVHFLDRKAECTYMKRCAIYALISVLETIQKVPEGLSGIFQYFIYPRLKKLKDRTIFAETLPLFAFEVERLCPESMSAVCASFRSIPMDVLMPMAHSLKVLAKRDSYNFFNAIFGNLIGWINETDEKWKIEIVKIFYEFYKNAKPSKKHKFRENTFCGVWPIASDLLKREDSSSALITQILIFTKVLFTEGYLSQDLSSEAMSCVQRFLYHSDDLVRFAATDVVKVLSPSVKIASVLEFAFERQTTTSTKSMVTTYITPEHYDPLITEQKCEFNPRFLASFHKRGSPVTHILQCGNVNQFYAIENGKKMYLMETPTQDHYEIIEHGTAISFRCTVAGAACMEENKKFVVGYSNSEIDIFGYDTGRFVKEELFMKEPAPSQLVTMNVLQGATCVAGHLGGEVRLFDIRSCDHHTMKLGFDNLMSACVWPNNYAMGFGFDGGIVTIIDSRMMLPICTMITNQPVQIAPVRGNDNTITVAVSDEHRLNFIQQPGNKNTLALDAPNIFITHWKSGLLLLDEVSVACLTKEKVVKLYEGASFATRLPETTFKDAFCSLGDYQRGDHRGLHMHESRIMCVGECGDMMVSGDASGFINVWKI